MQPLGQRSLDGVPMLGAAATRWGWAVLLAMAAHGLLLQSLLGSGARDVSPAPRWAPQPRWIDLPAKLDSPAAPAAPRSSTVPPPQSSDPTRTRPSQARSAQREPHMAQPNVAAVDRGPRAIAQAGLPELAVAGGPAVPSAQETAETSEPAGSPDQLPPLPSYATRLPEPFDLQFALRRGSALGSGELRFWRDEAGAYALSLHLQTEAPVQGPAGGRSLWQHHSNGRLTERGLQPERFSDRRRGRQVGTAQFDHEAGQVRFAGRLPAQPIGASVQDRLSWLVQLPAALAGERSLQHQGAQVWLQVVGARGGYQVWVFENLGPQLLTLPEAQGRRALHLRREPERPYDTAVDIWLDPAQGFLPLQIHLTHVPSGDRIELWRRP